MSLKLYKATTPGRRGGSILDWSGLSVKTRTKKLSMILAKKSGRNVTGKVTVRHQGGRHKRFLRIIDWKRDKVGLGAKVVSVEYDPNRTANIAQLLYPDGQISYILAPRSVIF